MNREEWIKSLKVDDKVIYIHSEEVWDARIGVIKSISNTKLCIQFFKDQRKGAMLDKNTGARADWAGWIQPYKEF
jgi:hypothetical protein